MTARVRITPGVLTLRAHRRRARERAQRARLALEIGHGDPATLWVEHMDAKALAAEWER